MILRLHSSDQQLFLETEEAAVDYVDEVLDGEGHVLHLDSTGSVSGLVEVEVDADYDVNALGPFQTEILPLCEYYAT